MSRNCINCHFFCKSVHLDNGQVHKFSLSEKERKVFKDNPIHFERGWSSLSCYMGVWDEGIAPVDKEEGQILFSKERKFTCFHHPYTKSMLFPAAVEMQKRSESERNLKRTNTYTLIGLWLAGLGLLINAFLEAFNLL